MIKILLGIVALLTLGAGTYVATDNNVADDIPAENNSTIIEKIQSSTTIPVATSTATSTTATTVTKTTDQSEKTSQQEITKEADTSTQDPIIGTETSADISTTEKILPIETPEEILKEDSKKEMVDEAQKKPEAESEVSNDVQTEEIGIVENVVEEPEIVNECHDGIDNDNDGDIDYDDKGCEENEDDIYESNQENENTYSAELDHLKGQYFSTTNYNGLDIADSVTIEAWVNVESDGYGFPNFVILTSPNIPNPLMPQYHLFKETNPGKWSGGDYTPGARWLDDAYCFHTTIININGVDELVNSCLEWEPVEFGDWFHIAVVYDRDTGQRRYYLNGNKVYWDMTPLKEEISQSEGGLFAIGGPSLSAANCNASGCGLLDGKIDEVRVWNVARSDSEIFQNYEKQLTGNETGLVGYWKFEENGNDSSTYGNDLVESGDPGGNGVSHDKIGKSVV